MKRLFCCWPHVLGEVAIWLARATFIAAWVVVGVLLYSAWFTW